MKVELSYMGTVGGIAEERVKENTEKGTARYGGSETSFRCLGRRLLWFWDVTPPLPSKRLYARSV